MSTTIEPPAEELPRRPSSRTPRRPGGRWWNPSTRPPFPDPRSTLAIAVVLAPVAVLAWMGWSHRWTSDDAFINFRIIRQMRAGHGPVFNVGDRVEAGTSILWMLTLAFLDLVTPVRIEHLALLGGLGATVGGFTLAVLGTRRVLLALGAPRGVLVPVGALVYAALLPAWDFATGGLENGLGVLWLGGCWWFLTGRLLGGACRDPSRPWWLPVVIGLGPLIRPDFAIFTALFMIALVLLGEPRFESVLLSIGLALALPLVTELFRMAYYGNVVPNTAVAKEGSLSNWHQGWLYLRDFFGPYLLLLPVAVLGGAFLLPALRRRATSDVRWPLLAGLTIAGGLAHGLYIVRVGGDYMHGRMLLPALFVVLLPISVVFVQGWRWAATAAVAVWALVCAASLRPSYSARVAGAAARDGNSAVNWTTGIGDSRLYYVRLTQREHPVTIDDYSDSTWVQAGLRTRALVKSGRRGLLVDGLSNQYLLIPLKKSIKAPVISYVGPLGAYSYVAGDDVFVVDFFGLVDAVPAHERLTVRGTHPGHEKQLPLAWLWARFAARDAPLANGITQADVDAARHALHCGGLAELRASTSAPLDLGRIVDNMRHSVSSWRLRFPPDPSAAEHELCGG